MHLATFFCVALPAVCLQQPQWTASRAAATQVTHHCCATYSNQQISFESHAQKGCCVTVSASVANHSVSDATALQTGLEVAALLIILLKIQEQKCNALDLTLHYNFNLCCRVMCFCSRLSIQTRRRYNKMQRFSSTPPAVPGNTVLHLFFFCPRLLRESRSLYPRSFSLCHVAQLLNHQPHSCLKEASQSQGFFFFSHLMSNS